jgi:hypothetical protein
MYRNFAAIFCLPFIFCRVSKAEKQRQNDFIPAVVTNVFCRELVTEH